MASWYGNSGTPPLVELDVDVEVVVELWLVGAVVELAVVVLDEAESDITETVPSL